MKLMSFIKKLFNNRPKYHIIYIIERERNNKIMQKNIGLNWINPMHANYVSSHSFLVSHFYQMNIRVIV